jgi:hypothetical protein
LLKFGDDSIEWLGAETVKLGTGWRRRRLATRLSRPLPFVSRCSPMTREVSVPKGDENTENMVEIDVDVPAAISIYRLFRGFILEMEHSAKLEWSTPQLRVADAQSSVVKLLQSAMFFLPDGDLKLLKPLDDARVALSELSFGGKHPLICDAFRPDDVVKRQRVTLVHQAQALIAIAYASLIPPCPGGTKPATAVKWLKKPLQDRRMPASGEDAQGWYYQARAKSGAQKLVEAFDDLQPRLLKLSNRAEAEAFALRCLDTVCSLSLPRLKLRGKPKKA